MRDDKRDSVVSFLALILEAFRSRDAFSFLHSLRNDLFRVTSGSELAGEFLAASFEGFRRRAKSPESAEQAVRDVVHSVSGV